MNEKRVIPISQVAIDGFPYVVVRRFSGCYTGHPAVFLPDDACPSDPGTFAVACHNPLENGMLSEKAKDGLIEKVRESSIATNLKMCIVFAPDKCLYFEPDGTTEWSSSRPMSITLGIPSLEVVQKRTE